MPTTVAKGAGKGSAHLVFSGQALPGLHKKDKYWTSAWCYQSDGQLAQWAVPDASSNSTESLIGQRLDDGWQIIYTSDEDTAYFAEPTERQAKDVGPTFTKKGDRVTIGFDALKLTTLGGKGELYLSGTVKCGEIVAW